MPRDGYVVWPAEQDERDAREARRVELDHREPPPQIVPNKSADLVSDVVGFNAATAAQRVTTAQRGEKLMRPAGGGALELLAED